MQTGDSKEILLRLKKIEGQIRGIQRLIEEGRDCEATLQQVSAARAALYKVGVHYVARHLRECLPLDESSPGGGRHLGRLIRVMEKFT